jgi:hypothetical protein
MILRFIRSHNYTGLLNEKTIKPSVFAVIIHSIEKLNTVNSQLSTIKTSAILIQLRAAP